MPGFTHTHAYFLRLPYSHPSSPFTYSHSVLSHIVSHTFRTCLSGCTYSHAFIAHIVISILVLMLFPGTAAGATSAPAMSVMGTHAPSISTCQVIRPSPSTKFNQAHGVNTSSRTSPVKHMNQSSHIEHTNPAKHMNQPSSTNPVYINRHNAITIVPDYIPPTTPLDPCRHQTPWPQGSRSTKNPESNVRRPQAQCHATKTKTDPRTVKS